MCIFGSCDDGFRLSLMEAEVVPIRRQAAVDIMHEIDVDCDTGDLDTCILAAAVPLSCLRMSADMMSRLYTVETAG